MGHTPTKSHSGGCGCGTCTIAPFSRNNYFTGKLLLERDFTDEQQYFRDKLRHHNQRLHGSGVVCGLEVLQHPNEDCRDRFVRLTPGTAIDCCGNEILVVGEEDIELGTLPAIAALDPDDEALHEVQLCLRFKECGNEPVPVLYDECGCDDDQCLPNRILESFEVDAILDPPASGPTWTGPALVRGTDLPFPEATVVTALGDGRLLVGEGTSVHLVDPGGAATVTKDLGTAVLALDPAPGGGFYATCDSGGALAVSVLDQSLSVTHEEAVPSSTAPVTSGVTKDGRLVLLQGATGTLTVYGKDLESGSPAAPATVTVDKERSLLAVHPTVARVFVAAGAASSDPDPQRVDVVDLDAATVAELATVPAGRVSSLVAGTDALVVATDDGKATGYAYADGSATGSAGLAGTAVDIAGTTWAYAVATSGGQSQVQSLGVDRLAAGRNDAAGPALGFGGDALAVASTPGAVYVAYAGAAGEPGGVAVFDVLLTSCRAEWDELGDCSSCEQPDCVVVATIHGYRPGFRVLDADPASDRTADAAARVARIDNHAGRVRLRPTSALEAAIECLMDGGTTGGGSGGPGAPGIPGKDGKDGTDGTDGTDGKDGKDGKDGTNGTNGTNGEPGRDGRDGEGLEQDLTQIELLSWVHRERVILGQRIVVDARGERRMGIVVSFTREVDATLVDAEHVFTVESPNPFAPGSAFEVGLRCRCPVAGVVEPVEVLSVNNGVIDAAQVTPGVQFSRAIAFIFDDASERLVAQLEDRADFWVRLQGEFVVDSDGRAVDAEFTRAELPTGDRPSGSKFGVQGGLFQSWFQAVLG